MNRLALAAASAALVLGACKGRQSTQSSEPAAAGEESYFKGNLTFESAQFENPCVTNVKETFANISRLPTRSGRQGDALPRFKFGPPRVVPLMTWVAHFQGLSRLQYTGDSKDALFAVSRSTMAFQFLEGDPGEIYFLGTKEKNSEGHAVKWVAGRTTNNKKNLNHAGGIQSVGKYLVAAVSPWYAVFDDINSDHEAFLYLLDTSPVLEGSPPTTIKRIPFTANKAGGAAMTRLRRGVYLMMAFGYNSQYLRFYVSGTKDLDGVTREDGRGVRGCQEDGLFSRLLVGQPGEGVQFRELGRTYQNMNLITECGTGDIYVAGFYEGASSAVKQNPVAENARLKQMSSYAREALKGNFGYLATEDEGKSFHGLIVERLEQSGFRRQEIDALLSGGVDGYQNWANQSGMMEPAIASRLDEFKGVEKDLAKNIMSANYKSETSKDRVDLWKLKIYPPQERRDGKSRVCEDNTQEWRDWAASMQKENRYQVEFDPVVNDSPPKDGHPLRNTWEFSGCGDKNRCTFRAGAGIYIPPPEKEVGPDLYAVPFTMKGGKVPVVNFGSVD